MSHLIESKKITKKFNEIAAWDCNNIESIKIIINPIWPPAACSRKTITNSRRIRTRSHFLVRRSSFRYRLTPGLRFRYRFIFSGSRPSLPWCGRISGQSEQTNKQMNARRKSTIIKTQKRNNTRGGGVKWEVNEIAARVWRPTTGQRSYPGLGTQASRAIEQQNQSKSRLSTVDWNILYIDGILRYMCIICIYMYVLYKAVYFMFCKWQFLNYNLRLKSRKSHFDWKSFI